MKFERNLSFHRNILFPFKSVFVVLGLLVQSAGIDAKVPIHGPSVELLKREAEYRRSIEAGDTQAGLDLATALLSVRRTYAMADVQAIYRKLLPRGDYRVHLSLGQSLLMSLRAWSDPRQLTSDEWEIADEAIALLQTAVQHKIDGAEWSLQFYQRVLSNCTR